MKLSQENIKLLSDCAEKRVRLIISGKNSTGQTSLTEGYILSGFVDGNKPKWISEYGFGFYIGQNDINSNGEEFKTFLPLYCHSKPNEFDNDKLYIENIVTEQGKIIYRNLDFEDLLSISLAEHQAKTLHSSSSPTTLSRYAKKLSMFIGKPVIYAKTNERLVLTNVYTHGDSIVAVATNGSICIWLNVKQDDIILDKQAYVNLDEYGYHQFDYVIYR